jgi:hypothetical protein
VRDLRARWALEEAGLPYRTRLLEQGDQDKPDYRALQPFGQVPILEEDGLILFESGGHRASLLICSILDFQGFALASSRWSSQTRVSPAIPNATAMTPASSSVRGNPISATLMKG